MKNRQSIDFSTVIASSLHDIKNSLAIVINTVDEIYDEYNQDPRLELIQAEGQNLNSKLVQLLALYRIEKKQLFTNIDSHNLSDFFEDIILENQAMIHHHSLNISINCNPDIEAYFDSSLIAGVLNSTLNNSFRYAEKNIELSATRVDNSLIIKIIDDGPGYPAEVLDQDKQKAFDINSQQTGLGLYFAQAVAELHHNKEQQGYIELSNRSTGGGIFSLHLP